MLIRIQSFCYVPFIVITCRHSYYSDNVNAFKIPPSLKVGFRRSNLMSSNIATSYRTTSAYSYLDSLSSDIDGPFDKEENFSANDNLKLDNPSPDLEAVVTSYLDALSSGKVSSVPSVNSVISYLDSIVSGGVSIPKSAAAIASNLASKNEGIGTSPLLTPSSFRSEEVASYFDPLSCSGGNFNLAYGDKINQNVKDCAILISKYFDAVSVGAVQPSSGAAACIASYIETLSSNRTSEQVGTLISYLDAAIGTVSPSPTGRSESSGEIPVAMSTSDSAQMRSNEGGNQSSDTGSLTAYLETLGPSNNDESSQQTLSFSDAISERCDTKQPTEECAGAITNYLDALSSSSNVQPSRDAAAGITSYLDSIASTDNSINPDASSGLAVTSYLDSVSSGEVLPPTKEAVSSYLDSISSGEVAAPSSGDSIASYLDEITLYLDAILEKCDGGESDRGECAEAIATYFYALSIGKAPLTSVAAAGITSYIDMLVSRTDSLPTGTSSAGAVTCMLDALSKRLVAAPSTEEVSSYLSLLSSGKVAAPTYNTSISSYFNAGSPDKKWDLEGEEEARIAVEQETARLKAKEEAVEQEAARLEAAEEANLAAEQEAAGLEAEEEARIAAEQEAARLEAEEEARFAAEQEAARLEAEEEARIAAEQELARLEAEEEERIAAEQEAARLEAEEEERIAAEQEAARLHAEEEERIAAEQEAARLKAEKEERIAAQQEAARLRAEEEARVAAEQEAARLQAEDEARIAAEQEAARLKVEEEARIAAEEEARIAAEEEAVRLKAEEDVRIDEELELRSDEMEGVKLNVEDNASMGEAARLYAEAEAILKAEDEARAQVKEAAAALKAKRNAQYVEETKAIENQGSPFFALEKPEPVFEGNPSPDQSQIAAVSPFDDAKGSNKSRTRRILEKVSVRSSIEQTSGAGGATTYEAFLQAEKNWAKLKQITNVDPPKFISDNAVAGNPKCWDKLRKTKSDKKGELDFDVLVCGGTLGIFFATALALRGYNVCVVEAGKLLGRQQEWNISMKELLELLEAGVISQEDIDACVTTEFPGCRSGFKNKEITPLMGGYSKNGIGYETLTPDVLNLGVTPSILLERVKQRFESLGGVVLENTRLQGVAISETYGVALDIGDDGEPVTSRLVLDCMGNASPISRQQRYGMKPDGVCCVVGSCASGYDKESNLIGDIIYTNTEIKDLGKEGKLQYFWEAFPVGIGRNGNEPGTSDVKTTYMFTYLDADEKRPSLETLMEDYWDLLPIYQPSITNPETDLDIKRVLFAFFPTYKDSPLKPQWSRLLAVGDASGIQSPLSFGGFGALTRHLERITDAVSDALYNDCLNKEDLGEINAYLPNLSAAWMFQKAMSVRMGQDVDPKFVNRLLASNFEVMDNIGPKTMMPFLQDVIRFDSIVASLGPGFVKDPAFIPEIVSHIGIPTLVEWLGHVGMIGLYTILHAGVRPALEPIVEKFEKDPRAKFRWRRRMDAWKYGSGSDYIILDD